MSSIVSIFYKTKPTQDGHKQYAKYSAKNTDILSLSQTCLILSISRSNEILTNKEHYLAEIIRLYTKGNSPAFLFEVSRIYIS